MAMYEAFFRLNERPYSISPDPRFLYLAPAHKEALGKCTYMITNKIGPVYITGPIGSGKTTIARRIYQQFSDDDQFITAMPIAPNLKTANAFLRTIMQEFEVKTARSYDQSLNNFSEFLKDQYRGGKSPVLLIDEAQNLNTDMLRLVHFLLNYETNTQKLLQIVLFGQNELATKIEHFPELKSRMFPSALAALTKDDTEALIQFRWQVAGGDQHPFDEAALEEVFRLSLGLPREVCKLCDLALLKAYHDRKKQIDQTVVQVIADELRLSDGKQGDRSPVKKRSAGGK